jgi:hypothetical protein
MSESPSEERMRWRAKALVRRAKMSGSVPVPVAELAESLDGEFPGIGRAQIVDEIARIAVAMGLSVEFGKQPRG